MSELVAEALATGTLVGLPSKHWIDGGWRDSERGEKMETPEEG